VRQREISTTTFRSKAGRFPANQQVLQTKQKRGGYMKGRIIDALRRPGFSRRDFNRMLASAGLSVAAMPLLSKPGAAAGDLTFYTWSGYDIPEICPKYRARHGTSPDIPSCASE